MSATVKPIQVSNVVKVIQNYATKITTGRHLYPSDNRIGVVVQVKEGKVLYRVTSTCGLIAGVYEAQIEDVQIV